MSSNRVPDIAFILAVLAVLAALAFPTDADPQRTLDERFVRATPLDFPPPVPPEIDRLRYEEPAPGDPRGLPPRSLIRDLPKTLPVPLPPLEKREAPRTTDPVRENRVVVKDRATGRVFEREIPFLEELLDSYTEAGIGLVDLLENPESAAKGFSGWAPVLDAAAGDFIRRVKLHIWFRDTQGILRGREGSGTLIDPMHILTAGHCLWAHDDPDNGWIFQDFAEEISVTPGYQAGDGPFGNAEWTALYVWPHWTDDRDRDHDIGIITLDRPLGSLAGWWGYGYDENCDHWTGPNWRHEGWPTGPPYHGEIMYQNMGEFDECPTDGWDNLVSWFSGTAPGLSGSGSVYTSNGRALAVLAASDGATETRACRMTSTKYSQVQQIVSGDKAPAFDLWALDVNGPPYITSGYRLDNLDFAVANYSHGAMGGDWNFSVYLSDDAYISTGDTHLVSAAFTGDFVDNTAVRVVFDTPPVIPADTPSGDYYLGVILTHTDWNNDNNASHGVEAHPINVYCEPSSPPTLLSPLDGVTCQARDIYFNWQPVAPLAEYRLRVGTDCDQGTVYETSMTSYTVHGLAPATDYHWRVSTRSQCDAWGDWGECRTLRIEPSTSTVSSPVNPPDSTHCVATTVTLEWAPLPDVATYDVQISPNWCYEGPITTGLASPQHTLTGLDPNTTYYWRVRSHTTCGQTTAWSSAPHFCWIFKTVPATIDPPTMTGPGDGTNCGAADTHLGWNHAEDWDHYEVQIGTSCAAGPVYSTTSNGYTPSGLVSGEVYYWRVRTFHECGLVSDWTPCWSFSLDLEPPTNPDPASLSSYSHQVATWSDDNTIDVSWGWGWDNCAGSWPQYATLWDQSPTTEPTVPTTYGEGTLETSPPLPDGQDHWFHVRTVDWAGNLALETLHLGPFWIDTGGPSQPEFDHSSHEPGESTGLTQLTVEWPPATDPAKVVAGYSWWCGTDPSPYLEPDFTVDTTDPFVTVVLRETGDNWFLVRTLDAAGHGSAAATLGPFTVDRSLFGLWFLSPGAGEVLREGDPYTVGWEVNTGDSAVATGGDLAYTTDGGAIYHTIADFTPVEILAESYPWTVPVGVWGEAFLRIRIFDTASNTVTARSRRFTIDQVSGTRDQTAPAADRVVLHGNRPNPFNPLTTIEYELPAAARVRLAVFDLSGRLVRILIDGREIPAGRHDTEWDGMDRQGRPVASGVYMYRLEAEGGSAMRRMVLAR